MEMINFKLEDLKSKMKNVADVNYREILCGKDLVTIVFVSDLCDTTLISNFIVKPLLNYENKKIFRGIGIEEIAQEVIMLHPAEKVNTLEGALNYLLAGNVLIFISSRKVLYCDAKGYPTRGITESKTEAVVKGPREGFTENVGDNLSSIRRRLKTPDLKVEEFKMGKQSQNTANMLYIQGVAPKDLVCYVRDKINSANNRDYILYSNHIEEALKCKGTPFDTIGYTEKPDTAAQKISEGRVILIMDGTAFALIAPFFFIESFQTTDDYTMNKFMANVGRSLRFLSFLLATLLPGLYLALVTHHFKLIPSIFLFKMAIFRAGIPLPTVLELLIMIIFFQIIREAGVRLPQPIGQSLSIVGALILGEATVRAGLASQVTVVIVGIASLCSYLVPKLYLGMFTWNSIIIILSSMLGLPGFYVGFVLFVSHLASLTTCGYPYLYPLGTRESFHYKDVTTRGDLSRISKNILQKDDEQ